MRTALATAWLLLAANGNAAQRVRHPDLRVGSNPVGTVRKVTSEGHLLIERTNTGAKGEICDVALWGVVLPKDKPMRGRAVGFLRRRLIGKEVRFTVMARTARVLTSNVLATDLKEGSPVNGYLVMIGLATSDRPKEFPFANALAHAKRNRLGLWAKRR